MVGIWEMDRRVAGVGLAARGVFWSPKFPGLLSRSQATAESTSLAWCGPVGGDAAPIGEEIRRFWRSAPIGGDAAPVGGEIRRFWRFAPIGGDAAPVSGEIRRFWRSAPAGGDAAPVGGEIRGHKPEQKAKRPSRSRC